MEQVLYKKQYSIREFYSQLRKGLRSIPRLKKIKKEQILSDSLIKRIMLAVTEVNGCEVCSYEHTKSALEMGMSEQEIASLLSGGIESIPNDELKAILFAQHYADTKGMPTKEAWREIVQTYGDEKAQGIVAATQVIMMGNSYGIALSAFKSRLKGRRIPQSNLLYELSMLVSIIPLLPLGILHALFAHISKKDLITFDEQ